MSSSQPNQPEDTELREKLREEVGLFKYAFKYHDYIKASPGTLGGKYPSSRAIEELDGFMDRIMPIIEAEASRREQAMLDELEAAREPYFERVGMLQTVEAVPMKVIEAKRQALNEKEKRS